MRWTPCRERSTQPHLKDAPVELRGLLDFADLDGDMVEAHQPRPSCHAPVLQRPRPPRRPGACAVSSAPVARKITEDRPSTRTGRRESFYGRFSTTNKERGKALKKRKENLQLLLLMVIAFDLVFGFVRPFVAEPMYVPSESMAPTLQVGDRVLTNKLAYDFLSGPERGDLVVFEDMDKNKDEDVVKRVIGLPGDEISVEDGTLLVNGEPPHEPYLDPEQNPQETPALETFGPVFVPKDHVFVMGDNRANSYDSRFFGPVPNDNLVGEVSLRFWPTDRLGTPS